MKNIIKYIGISLGVTFFLLSCEVNNFDLQDNPNVLTPESADSGAFLNEIQFLFQDIMGDMNRNTDDIMRYEAMTDNYGDVASSTVLNAEWERFYEALNISRNIEAQAATDPNLLFTNAISKLLLGYLSVTLVDYVGSIPYSEASNPEEFPNPKLDNGVDIYKTVLADIDQAILDINASTFSVDTDLFYGNDKTKWIAFANSFKLRLLIQTRLASNDLDISNLDGEINTLLSMDLIDTESEDFVYRHAAVEEPESRHLYFTRGYISGFSTYIGNYFMWMLKDSKTIRDPRIRYYLYRQDDRDPFTGPPYLACGGDPAVDFCYVGDHYWGLDHGETRTGRGDNNYRTTFGIYPGGGAFDEDQFIVGNETTNLAGAGIIPILTSFQLKFLTAEAALTLGTNGDPAVLLEEAIRASMSKVLNFGGVSSSFEATSSDVDDYVNEVIANYIAAGSDEERLDIIMTESYLAGFGNSIEAYNAYRRTGYPSNLQIPIDDDNPTFPRSFPYADEAVNFNSSITQKQNTVKVFWDTNPDGFIK